MILYVFIVWLCAAAGILVLEYFLLFFLGNSRYSVETLLLAEPQFEGAFAQGVAQDPESNLFLIVSLLFLGALVFGYICEVLLHPVGLAYRHLQKSYPSWYQKLPAPKREMLLACFLPFFPFLGLFLLCLIFVKPSLFFLGIAVACWSGGTVGLSILPILRYRQLLLEDRPEKPPEALIQKVLPVPSQFALGMGQIYLRFVLPLFFLFGLLILPLHLEVLQLATWEAWLMFGGLIAGVLGGWFFCRESHLEVACFRENFLNLAGILGGAGALLIFGCASENGILLPMMGFFSGFLVSSY